MTKHPQRLQDILDAILAIERYLEQGEKTFRQMFDSVDELWTSSKF